MRGNARSCRIVDLDWRLDRVYFLTFLNPSQGQPDPALTARLASLCNGKRADGGTRSIYRSCRIACTAVPADNPEPPARGTSELKTRSASALLEQYEARLGQHSLLPRGQAEAGLASRQVADYLNDLDQIP